ncbi:MAG: AarF/UbiB family protein, partial [Deltaproteobacteria bacterium]
GIARAIESDLSNAGILESVVGVAGGRRFDSRGMLEVIRERFREELNYTLEAERQRAFAAVHHGNPRVMIPRVIDDRSGPHVLTSTFVRGASFDEALDASPEERRAWAVTLWHFVFKGTLVAGMFNADPHPGNYLFQGDGRIAFLDFGCVQAVPPHRLPIARALHRAAIDHDDAGFRAPSAALTDARPGPLEELSHGFMRQCFAPLCTSPYRITRPYAAGLVEAMREMGMTARTMHDDHVFSMPPEMLFMNRLQFGFYSVLARLDVEVDYAEIERTFV